MGADNSDSSAVAVCELFEIAIVSASKIDPGKMTEESNAITFVYECTTAERREGLRILAGSSSPTALGRSRSGTINSRKSRGLVGWILFLGLAILLFFLVSNNKPAIASPAPPPPPTPNRLSLGDIGFILGMVLCVVGYLRLRAMDWRKANRWNGQKRYWFSPQGVAEQRPGREEFRAWGAFIGFEESKKVFVLRTQPTRGMIFPKRLFAGEEERDQFRDLLRQNIARRAIPVDVGFPVIQ
jgi:hypothetical protein